MGVLGSAHEYADRRRRFEITTLTSQPAHFITMTELESHQEFEYEEVLNGFKESENKSEYLMGLNFALRADIISSLPSNEISGLESQVLTEYFSVMNNLDDTLKSQAHSQIRTLADNAMHLNVTLSKLNHQSAQNVAEVIKQDPNFAERSYLNLTKHVLGISDQVNLDEQLSYFETQLPDFESYMQDKDVFANYVRRLNVEMDRDKLPLVFLISEFHKNRESQMDRNRRGLVSVPAEQTFAQALLGFRTRLEQVQGDLESDSTRQIESIVRQWGNYNITNRSTLDLLAGDGGLCENRAIMSYLLARTVSPDKPLRMMHTDQLDPSTQDFVRHVELIQPYTITYEDGETFSSHRAYAPNVKLYKDADVLEFSTNADENILNGVQEYLGLRDREQAQRSVDGDFVDTLPDINGYGPVLSSTGYLVQDAPNIRAQQESANNTLLDSDPTNVIGSIAYQNRIRNFNKAFEDVTDPLKSRHRDLLEQVFLKSNMTIQRLNTYLESDGGELYVETLSDDLIDLLAQQPPNVVNSLFRFSRLTRYMSFDPNRFRKLVDLGLRFNDEVVNPVTVTGDSNLVNVELNIKFCYERFGSRVLLNFQDERQLNLRFLQRIKDKVILNNLTRSIFDARADLDGLHIMEAGYGDQSISSNVKFVSEFFVNSESNISRENLRDDLNVSKLVLDERSNLTSMPVQEFLVQQTRQEISLRTHNTRLLRYILDEGQALNVSLRTEPEHVNENLSILESYYSNTAEQRRALSQVSLPDSLDSLIESPVPVRQIDEQVEMQDIASLRAADRRLNKNVKISLYFMSVADFRNVLPRLQQLVQASEFKLRFEVEINNLNSESDETYQATLREISSARNINLHEDT